MDSKDKKELLAKLGNGLPDVSNEKDQKPGGKKDNGYSRSTNLSALYGIVVVLVGLVVPMTEALRGDWMSSHLIAMFLTYLYSGASIFIGYMHIHENILKRATYRLMQAANAPKEDNSDDSDDSSDHSDTKDEPEYDPQETYNRFHEMRQKAMSNNLQLGMIEEEESEGSETDDDKHDTKSNSSSSSASTTVTIEESRPRRVTFAPSPLLPSSGPPSGAFRRRRFSTVPGLAMSTNLKPEDSGSTDTVATLDETPDDVYNYIAMNNATATMADDGTNFFMKGGSLIFAVANIVYIALRIEGEHQIQSVCHQHSIIYPHYLHMGFIVMQSFFLLKECQFVYRQNKLLVRFGLIHLIATNLCVWLRYLMIEVDESLMHQKQHDDGHHAPDPHSTNYSHATQKCEADPIMFKAGPYLFPFVLEYSLVASSTAAFIYSSINIRVSKELYRAICKAIKKRRSSIDETQLEPDYDDPFSKSHMGLFAGVVVFACVIISTIFFFYWTEKETLVKATLCYRVSETILMIMLIVATLIASVHFANFEVNLNQSNTLDHGLLLVSVSLYIILESFKLISTCVIITNEGSNAVRSMALTTSLFSLIQCISQTVFIIDGMQRVAHTDDQRQKKYGRGAVTFLIITNVAAWVFKSFQEKRVDSEPELNFYGDVAWTIISSTALPLILFYRFHSSICLAHMWGHCYKKHEEDLDSKVIL